MNKTTKLINYYNGIAPGYCELYHQEQRKKISLVLSHLPSRGSLLDAGSGAGILYEFLPKSLEIIAVDISEELLKKNPFKNKQKENLENLSFPNQYFDTITSFTVLQDIEHKKQAIQELKRVLKPQGKLIISFLKISKHKELIEKEINKSFKIVEKKEEEKDIIIVGLKK